MRSDVEGTIYILCFRDAAGKKAALKHAGHYIGWSENFAARMKDHKTGRGSALVAAAVASGLSFVVTNTWTGTRHLERRFKLQRNAYGLCPHCKAAHNAKKAEQMRQRRKQRRLLLPESRVL